MSTIKKLINALVSGSIPILVSGLSLLILLSPAFINLEYRRPGFPEDSYGFTLEERLEFGNQTRRYLISGMTLSDLKELEFAEGGPIYIDRELSHLEDVKVVLQGVFKVLSGAAGVFFAGAILAYTTAGRDAFARAISLGGRITTGLLLLLLIFTLASFQALFTNFHRIFFEGDSWLFYYSDTLIRLFPIRFWQDIFLAFGLITLIAGITLGWLLPAWLGRVRVKSVPPGG